MSLTRHVAVLLALVALALTGILPLGCGGGPSRALKDPSKTPALPLMELPNNNPRI